MKLENFLTNCRNRKQIVTKQGKLQSSRCGYCRDCITSRANRYVELMGIESEHSVYQLFVTLKYDEFNVPRVRLYEVDDYILLIEDTKRKLKTPGKYKTFNDYSTIVTRLNTNFQDEIFFDFFKKAQPLRPSSLCPAPPYRILRYCRTEDFQNFIKRLRDHVYRVCGEKIRYFGVSEYGPQTFRPHFHISLYFNSPSVALCIQECIRKAWKFGTIDTSFARNSTATNKYISHYVNSNSHLPIYLSHPKLRPRTFHSVKMGSQFHESLVDYCYEDVRRAITEISLPFNATVYAIQPTTSVISAVFPKCFNFSRQNSFNLYKLYTLYRDLRQQYPHLSTSAELTRQCLVDFRHNPTVLYALKRLEVFDLDLHEKYKDNQYSTYTPGQYEEFIYLYRDDPDSVPPLFKTIYNRIYSAIHLSKNFLTYVCKKQTPGTAISLIKEFYHLNEQFKLRTQYEMMELYAQRGFTDFTLFFYNSKDYEKKYRSDILIKYVNHQKDIAFENRIKHKQQNDLNEKYTQFI